ncbi:cupin domain-containing protein [Klebsiella aerogenes]|uniref:cupin domain-containing protein n=1 Tax=Klebsiella aerogenes TaxID=548 RepID=UPI0037BAAC82
MKKQFMAIGVIVASSCVAGFSQADTTDGGGGSKLPAGVKSEVLNSLKIADIHLPTDNKPLTCRSLRFRTVDVQPGSHIDLHSHENRPAMLGVLRGSATVYPYQHKPVTLHIGDSYKEYANVHYAINDSATDMLTMTTFDLLDDGSSCNGVTYPQNTPLLDKLKAEHVKYYVDAPKNGGMEKSTPVYSHKVYDIRLPKQGAGLTDRIMRVRKVSLAKGIALPQQDFSNRPTYLLVLDGSLDVMTPEHKELAPVGKSGTVDLVNVNEVTIRNHSATTPASYLVFELWDPKDAGTI